MSATTTAPRSPTLSSPDDIDVLIRRWQRDRDESARLEIVERFLPLARRLAGRYRNPTESVEDLTQVAAVGLLGAIDRFDPDRGARFQSFAIPTMLGEIKRYFRDTGWTAHVPRRAKELALLTERAVHELSARHGHVPRVDELAEHLQLSVEDVLVGLEAGTAHYAVSIDAPTPLSDSDEPQPLADQLGGIDGRLDLVDVKLSLADAITRLPHLERTALRLRLDHGLRQTDVAARMGCSQMQVSRLLRRAASRIRELIDPTLTASC